MWMELNERCWGLTAILNLKPQFYNGIFNSLKNKPWPPHLKH